MVWNPLNTIGGYLFGDDRPELREAGRKYDPQYDQLLGALSKQAYGQESISREMLRQGLMRNIAAQNSLAASARPGQAGVARRQAAQNAANLGAGLSGQQALAGIVERKQAMESLQNALYQKQNQELDRARLVAGEMSGAEKFLSAAKDVATMMGVGKGGGGGGGAGPAAMQQMVQQAPAPAAPATGVPAPLMQAMQPMPYQPAVGAPAPLAPSFQQTAMLSPRDQLWQQLYGGLQRQGVRF